jgi:shikimate dehydrogenase
MLRLPIIGPPAARGTKVRWRVQRLLPPEARRDGLISRLNALSSGKCVIGSNDPASFGVVINATLLGMKYQDYLAIQIDRLEPYAFVGDVVTSSIKTLLIEKAEKKGCRTLSATGMFESQIDILVDFLIGNRTK